MSYTGNNTSAFIVNAEGQAERLPHAPYMSSAITEDWLTRLLTANPSMLPAAEFGPEYAPLVCVGTDIPAPGGKIDALFVTPSGYLTAVVTRLFRGQNIHRDVVAQAIDIAHELQSWDAAVLDETAEAYTYQLRGQSFRIIDEMVRLGYLNFGDASALANAINLHISEGAFLILVAGDGIRSNVRDLVAFLDDNVRVPFKLGMVEIATFSAGDDFVCVPQLLAKTGCDTPTAQATVTIFRGNSVKPAATFSYSPRQKLSRRDFISTFSDNGTLDDDEVTEFITDLDIISGVIVALDGDTLQIRASTDDGDTFPLMTFGISGNRADVWIVPGVIRDHLERHGIFPFEADDFLHFFKRFLDKRYNRTAPYENPDARYYANVSDILDSAQLVIAAVEQFVTTISHRD